MLVLVYIKWLIVNIVQTSIRLINKFWGNNRKSSNANFVPNHLKTQKMFKNAIKRFPFVILYVPDQYKTQEMCGKVILEKDGMLRFVSDCYKNQKISNKVVNTLSSAIQFVSHCYETHYFLIHFAQTTKSCYFTKSHKATKCN